MNKCPQSPQDLLIRLAHQGEPLALYRILFPFLYERWCMYVGEGGEHDAAVDTFSQHCSEVYRRYVSSRPSGEPGEWYARIAPVANRTGGRGTRGTTAVFEVNQTHAAAEELTLKVFLREYSRRNRPGKQHKKKNEKRGPARSSPHAAFFAAALAGLLIGTMLGLHGYSRATSRTLVIRVAGRRLVLFPLLYRTSQNTVHAASPAADTAATQADTHADSMPPPSPAMPDTPTTPRRVVQPAPPPRPAPPVQPPPPRVREPAVPPPPQSRHRQQPDVLEPAPAPGVESTPPRQLPQTEQPVSAEVPSNTENIGSEGVAQDHSPIQTAPQPSDTTSEPEGGATAVETVE